MKLDVDFYRQADGMDYTLGGVSSGHRALNHEAVLIWDEEFRPGTMPLEINGRPVLVLVRRMIYGREYLHAEPVGANGKFMWGGNFIYSSDGRFPNDYPLKVHDRDEKGIRQFSGERG